jgi:hypothetical protein
MATDTSRVLERGGAPRILPIGIVMDVMM